MSQQKMTGEKTVRTEQTKEQRTDSEAGKIRENIEKTLGELGIPYLELQHAPVRTSADCTQIAKELGTNGCKNLFLRNPSGTAWYLVMLPPEEKADLKKLALLTGEKRLSFAGTEDLKRLLHTEPGAVSVRGLCFDTDSRIKVLIHEKILKCRTIGCHPCINTASLRIAVSDLTEKFLEPFGSQRGGAVFYEYRRRKD